MTRLDFGHATLLIQSWTAQAEPERVEPISQRRVSRDPEPGLTPSTQVALRHAALPDGGVAEGGPAVERSRRAGEPSPSDPSVDAALRIAPGLALNRAELRWRFSRASGPGGQNVNKTDARVELRYPLVSTESLPPPLRQRALARLADRLVDGHLVVVAEEHRSQIGRAHV